MGEDLIGGIGAKVIPKKTYKMKGLGSRVRSHP
jgi:hypothetical protein